MIGICFCRVCRLFCAAVLLLLVASDLVAQKIVIDSNTYGHWPDIGAQQLSPDGKYLIYSISNIPDGKNTLYLQSIAGKWEKEFVDAGLSAMTHDGHKAVFVQNSRLCICILGEEETKIIDSVDEYQLVTMQDSSDLLAYKQIGSNNLVVKNLSNGKEDSFGATEKYWFSDNGQILAILTSLSEDTGKMKSLIYIDLNENRRVKIWAGRDVNSLLMARDGQQLGFVSDEDGKPRKTIWYYQSGNGSAVKMVDSHTEDMDSSNVLMRLAA